MKISEKVSRFYSRIENDLNTEPELQYRLCKYEIDRYKEISLISPRYCSGTLSNEGFQFCKGSLQLRQCEYRGRQCIDEKQNPPPTQPEAGSAFLKV